MPRPRKKHIQIDRSEITNIGPKTRDLVECKCMLHCNGSKLVDPRTFRSHRREAERLRAIASGSQSTGSTISRPVDVGSSTSMRSEQEAETSMRRSKQEVEESQDSSNGYSSYSSDKSDQATDQELIDKPTKRK
jgi:hypothetical protein